MAIALREGALPPNGTLQWSAHAARAAAALGVGGSFESDAYVLAGDAVVLRPASRI